MKRILGIGIAYVLMATCVALATVNVYWTWDENTQNYVYQDDGTTLLPAGSIVQLIYVPFGGVNTGYDNTDPLTPNPGNTVLATFSTSGDGYWFYDVNQFPVPGVAGQYVGGYVFQRVFDTPFGNDPADGSYYADGPLSAALGNADANPAPAPTVSFFFQSSAPWPSPGGFTLTEQLSVVPEPTTWALIGIGALAIFIRRRRA